MNAASTLDNNANGSRYQDSTAIGIDLGTTFSCVGVVRNGRVDILANDLGNRTTPSYVAFVDGDRLVGDGAKLQSATNATNTVYDVKRLIGRRFSDREVQQDASNYPFKVVSGPKDNPLVEVEVSGQKRRFAPEEISAAVLAKMKAIAEQHLGCSVTQAVITVPAYFNDAQRSATKEAGSIAGLEVLRIVNEPTAAALAYGLESGKMDTTNVLVFDLGGGTFDVTVLTIDNGVYEVRSTDGDTRLGGEDFDDRLAEWATKEFASKTGLVVETARAKRRLRTACERAKRALTTQKAVVLEVESLVDGVDMMLSLTRARFEDLCEDLFDRCIRCAESAIRASRLSVEDIHDVVLVGGSSRIPRIQEKLQAVFKGKPLRQTINPDEAVAYGAAVQASILSARKTNTSTGFDIVLIDVAPLSLGVRTQNGRMHVLVNRNTAIPFRASQVYSTAEDHQSAIKIQVFEGERPMCEDNNMLGEFELVGLPPLKAGKPRILVEFEVDANGILVVSAKEQLTNTSAKIVIQQQQGRKNKDEIERMIADAEKFKEQDKITAKRMDALNTLETHCRRLSNFAKKPEGSGEGTIPEVSKLRETQKAILARLGEITSGCESWIREHGSKATYDEIENQLSELEDEGDPLVKEFYESLSDSDLLQPENENSVEETRTARSGHFGIPSSSSSTSTSSSSSETATATRRKSLFVPYVLRPHDSLNPNDQEEIHPL